MAASTAVCFGALTRFVVTGLKLTDVLQPYPAGTVYSPTNIKRINFAPDPCEDYHDSPLPIRLVEIKVDPTRGRSIRIIASVGDGRRLRDWAVRKGVEIFDPTNMLVETPGQTV
ncbi:MAG TPA: hypothetical protein VHR66_09380 [Gemmataceae bacterium]|nr:hypothetical protein [Gemmataceae bacterium]